MNDNHLIQIYLDGRNIDINTMLANAVAYKFPDIADKVTFDFDGENIKITFTGVSESYQKVVADFVGEVIK